MKVVRILILLMLVPVFAFAQYKIVLKNGKVIEGKYLHEDETNIYIESNGIQMNFKKERLDLDKMKELNAKIPTPDKAAVQKVSSNAATLPKAGGKKPARVYTTEDLKQMKEIWDEGKSETETAPISTPAAEMPAQPEAATQTTPVAPVQTASSEETQSQPASPVESIEPTAPRAEKTIREEIETIKLQIAEAEKRIQDLRAKGRVTETWEKLVAKQKQRILDLQQEIKDLRAVKRATQ